MRPPLCTGDTSTHGKHHISFSNETSNMYEDLIFRRVLHPKGAVFGYLAGSSSMKHRTVL